LTTKFTRHTAACSRRDEQLSTFQLSIVIPSEVEEPAFLSENKPQQTTTRRANSMGLNPAHRTHSALSSENRRWSLAVGRWQNRICERRTT